MDTKKDTVEGLLLSPLTDTVSDWVAQVSQDPLAFDIIESQPFKRLKKISFLGAMDYLASTSKLAKTPRTRAHHSLHVAAIAKYVAHHRGYSEELNQHLVVAGLLHDIGHPPLSHSVEPYLKQRFGYGHHEMGDMVISGKYSSSRNLSNLIKNNLDINFINELISGKAKKIDGGDLFSSPINIDTIEGIIRTYRYLNDTPCVLDPLKVAKASFLDKGDSRFKTLDAFWSLKGFIYDNVITRDVGLIADQYSQIYFNNNSSSLNEMELLENESHWQRKYQKLFAQLLSIKSLVDIPVELQNQRIQYKRRYYLIKKDQISVRRYFSNKVNVEISLAAKHQLPLRQLSIFKVE